MCGIVGAVLRSSVTPFLLEGLQRMEYRGYDSAGVAVLDDNHHLERVRTQGKVAALVEAVKHEPLDGKMGIAHTRWATHGVPSERNAHPHIAGDTHQIAVVHNGIIENFEPLKEALIKKGYSFNSQTDSEVIAYLIYDEMQKGLGFRESVLSAANQLQGAYALGVISTRDPDHLMAVRSGAPLVIGLGEGENYFASDHLALLPVTQQFIYLDEGDIAEVYLDRVQIYNAQGQSVERPVKTSSADSLTSVDKGDYPHYMLKEIHEQSSVVLETMQGRLGEHQVFDGVFGTQADAIFKQTEQVHIVACGTSYHAGLVARYWIEHTVGIPCQVDVASEYRYRQTVVPKNTLFIVISQSGETADTLAALRKAKELKYLSTLAICNVPESAMVREAALTLLTRAGAEIGVASTKAFMTQLLSLAMLTLSLAKDHGVTDASEHIKALVALPRLLDKALLHESAIKTLAEGFKDKHHALFVARGTFFPIALEGALKLKEISYIHAEAYPAGELKHGPLALVDSEMPVIAIVHNDALSEKTLSNLQEIKARGGQLIIFTDIPDLKFAGAQIVNFADCAGDFFTAPMLMTIPMQLLAYHVAVLKGTDVDQPRNLAKSVTVE
jgi:glucosamine--fructose-6-phosphate aminotransferase (isomerizing)